MGLMKTLYTKINTNRFVRGGPGAESKSKLRKQARDTEEWIRERIRMSFCTEAQFRQWLLKNQQRKWAQCTACPLKRYRSCVVYGDGAPEPLLLIVGGAPVAADEDEGRAFAGADGVLLKRVCAKSGIDFDRDVYSTNMVLCRPPRERQPEKTERRACNYRLEEQVKTVTPYVILLLGNTALRWATTDERAPKVQDHRGLLKKDEWPSIPFAAKCNLKAVFATHHPTTILAQDSKSKKKRLLGEFVEDVRNVGRVVTLLNSKIERSHLTPEDEADYEED